jgi:hypothetical protein
MNAAPPHVPASLAGDPTEVTTALDVAGALWDKGDNSEAIRWLKRAVVAATDSGQTARARDLAQAAGELQLAMEVRATEASLSVRPPVESSPPSIPPALAPPGQEPWPDSSKRVQLAPAAVPSDAPAHAPPDGWLRVSVKTSVRDPKLFVLRPLAEGEAAPPRTREGFLMLPDPPSSAPKKPNGSGAA